LLDINSSHPMPTMTTRTDWRKTCAELIENVRYLIDCVDRDCFDPVCLMECREHLFQTRTALAQSEPEGPTERIASIATAIQECAFGWEPTARLIGNVCAEDVADLCGAILARYALAQPEPEVAGLSDEEVLDLADDCGLEKQEITTWDGESRTVDHGWECTDAQLVTFATALITRYARPTIKPVPVAERPWEREKGWRDLDGECWWCPPDGPPYWQMANPAMVYGGWLLPHHALPVPGAEVG
jgi:hypothetical protein